MIRTLLICASLTLQSPAWAQEDHTGYHQESQHDAKHMDSHHEGEHKHDAKAEDTEATGAALVHTAEIHKALEEGGEPIVVDVLGVVCDFCAKAMNKTFGKRDEVAATYVDLDTKTLSIVLTPGASLSDEDIEKLVKKSGYKTSAIRRGEAALNGVSE